MEVLPDNYYKAEHVGGAGNDAEFIADQISEINFNQRANACIAYSKIFIEEGRAMANTRLRKYVEKCKAKNNGCTITLKPI